MEAVEVLTVEIFETEDGMYSQERQENSSKQKNDNSVDWGNSDSLRRGRGVHSEEVKER